MHFLVPGLQLSNYFPVLKVIIAHTYTTVVDLEWRMGKVAGILKKQLYYHPSQPIHDSLFLEFNLQSLQKVGHTAFMNSTQFSILDIGYHLKFCILFYFIYLLISKLSTRKIIKKFSKKSKIKKSSNFVYIQAKQYNLYQIIS